LISADYFEALRAISQPIRAADLPLTLDPMTRLLDALGSPQRRFPAVVVTGSTGKGTTCLRLAEMLALAGRKVGLYTSPHLHLFRERSAILESVGAHGRAPLQMITQQEFVAMARPVLDAARALVLAPQDWRYSTFEYATAIALSWFAAQQIDIAVLEVGIGGRFDAVNAVENALAVFTPIEAEHVAMLGGSLESVAWHKAGIIQPGGAAITIPQTPAVWAVLEREAHEKGASLEVADDVVETAVHNLTPYPPLHVVERGYLPGRLERIVVNGRVVIIDGGHTPAAAHYLRAFISDAPSIRLIVGMLRDKDAAAYLSVFDAPNVHFVYTRAPGDRALTPDRRWTRH
jgi:folylpolyglutamate synthase/dihydropteroate synthase